jgi:hypothetical protein
MARFALIATMMLGGFVEQRAEVEVDETYSPTQEATVDPRGWPGVGGAPSLHAVVRPSHRSGPADQTNVGNARSLVGTDCPVILAVCGYASPLRC